MKARIQCTLLALMVAVLPGCGGGGGSGGGGGGGSGQQTLSPGGIFQGQIHSNLSNQTHPIYGWIGENGHAFFYYYTDSGSPYYSTYVWYLAGQVNATGSSFSGTFSGRSPSTSQTFPNGSTTTSGSLSGQIQERVSLDGTYAAEGNDTGTLSLTYDHSYESPLSLAQLAGSWQMNLGSGNALNININADGTYTGTNTRNGCPVSGRFAFIDNFYNAYDATYSETCGGGWGNLTGTATYISSTLYVGLSYVAPNSGTFGLLILTRN